LTTRILKYFILLALALFIVAISSFWFGQSSFREGDVVLELIGPIQISSGDEVVYNLKYANNTRSVLNDLVFFFFYPEGSNTIVDGKLIRDHSESFMIDSLEPGESGEKTFRAFILGERGNIRIAKTTLAFKAGNLKSSFEKTSSLSTTIISAPISLNLGAPPNVVSGAEVNYLLDYRNNKDEDMTDLIIEFDYPDGFSPHLFEPEPKTGNNIWTVKFLKKGGGGRIDIKGILVGNEGDSKIISVILKRKINGEYVDYQRTSAATTISNPVLGVEVFVNNSSDYSSSLGDRLSYTIKYSNNSNLNLIGMNLTVKLEGDMFDLSTLDTRGGFFDDSANSITWNSSSMPEFANFSPNSQGKINFYLTLKSSFASGASQDRFVKVMASFKTPNVPKGLNPEEVSVSSSLVTRISTRPSFNQLIYHNDPEFGFSGMMPPRVGEETSFSIYWNLTNPGNDVTSAKIKAKLPIGVEWEDMTSVTPDGQKPPTYNPNSSIVEWDLDKLPYGAGIFAGKYGAAFKVKIKPSSIQRGQILTIIEDVQFTGVDGFTGQEIVLNGKSLNSNETVDRPREGTVQ